MLQGGGGCEEAYSLLRPPAYPLLLLLLLLLLSWSRMRCVLSASVSAVHRLQWMRPKRPWQSTMGLSTTLSALFSCGCSWPLSATTLRLSYRPSLRLSSSARAQRMATRRLLRLTTALPVLLLAVDEASCAQGRQSSQSSRMLSTTRSGWTGRTRTVCTAAELLLSAAPAALLPTSPPSAPVQPVWPTLSCRHAVLCWDCAVWCGMLAASMDAFESQRWRCGVSAAVSRRPSLTARRDDGCDILPLPTFSHPLSALSSAQLPSCVHPDNQTRPKKDAFRCKKIDDRLWFILALPARWRHRRAASSASCVAVAPPSPCTPPALL